MGNLLNLLKQYWKETFGDEKLSKIEYEEKSDCFYWIYQPLPWMKLEQGQILDSSTVLSKKFQFIQWLVENDKINRWRVENNQDYAEYLWNLPLEEYGTEVLLMLLSIADEPIDYLCNLLFKFE